MPRVRYLCIILSILFGIWGHILPTFGAISFSVTPIKYELELEPGESITLPASITNNGDESVTLPTTTSDFTTRDTTGTPRFVRRSELVYPDQQLSSWITLSDSAITLAPRETGSIDFTINVPENAEPGGHYGAVFFKNPGSEVSSSGNVGINVDYGILILVKVSGETIIDIQIDPPKIKKGNRGAPIFGNNFSIGDKDEDTIEIGVDTDSNPKGCNKENKNINCITVTKNPAPGDWYIGQDITGSDIYQKRDTCPAGDFTTSMFDGKCFGASSSVNLLDDLGLKDFSIDFELPVKNTGNIHIQPTGKIILIDSDGNTLKSIGKESIVNENGAVIGQKIVDYIPINDQFGSVLPKSERIFEARWQGFPYEDYDEAGRKIISYWSPSEYYTRKNIENAGFLMFWQRESEVRRNEMMTAKIEFSYPDENGEPVTFNSAQEFPVQYIEKRVTLNPYVILGLLLSITALGLIFISWYFWWFAGVRKRKCWNCRKKISSNWDTCPYCTKLQDKKLQRQLEKNNAPTPEKALGDTTKTSTRKTASKTTSSKKNTIKKQSPTTKKTTKKSS